MPSNKVGTMIRTIGRVAAVTALVLVMPGSASATGALPSAAQMATVLTAVATHQLNNPGCPCYAPGVHVVSLTCSPLTPGGVFDCDVVLSGGRAQVTAIIQPTGGNSYAVVTESDWDGN